MKEWREDGQRYNYGYSVYVNGLSGRKAVDTTTVLVPIPATKDGRFVITPSQKGKGPYFPNTTEKLDNKLIIGNWTTFIAETDDGYMLGFRTNESTLKDISYGVTVVVDYIDIFNPIYKNGPILYPVRNLSNISMIPYRDQIKYSSNPTYESYVYLSDNIEEGITNFDITLDASNDPTEWAQEYRGSYLNKVYVNTGSSGKIKVRATLEQSIGAHKQTI